jgi:aryl-alcohol dehydrogenase-like predicted oxidoreductase
VIYRSLGRTGLTVSVIGLGCSHLGAHRGRTRAELVRLLEHAVDRGVTFFDTADIYMGGESERLLGEALVSHRGRVIIATKVGLGWRLPQAVVAYARPYLWSVTRRATTGSGVLRGIRGWFRRGDYSSGYLRPAVEASLTRLRSDRIDLLQLHSPTAAALDRDGALETLERLAAEGKIRFFGLAFGTASQAQHALGDGRFATLQIPVSRGEPAATHDLLAWAQSRAIGVIANQPLRGGASLHARGAATRHGDERTIAQAAIGYVASLPAVSTVIVGTTSVAHLDEGVAALRTALPTSDHTT